MILVLTLISVLLLVFAIWLWCECDSEYLGGMLVIVSGIGFAVCVISIICLVINVSGLRVIDQKIEMYEQENTKIETQISDMVQQYQEYENGIFTEVAPESAMTLVSLYPELKSDALVQKQIEVYLENNNKIKELKEAKIDGSVKRWWLYFGS